MALDMSMLRRVDRFLGVGLDAAGDREIAEFAKKYSIGIGGLLDNNGISYAQFKQFLWRVTMTADVLCAYLQRHPIVHIQARGYVPGIPMQADTDLRVVIGNRVEGAIKSYDLDKNQSFYAGFTTFSDQQNAFAGALRQFKQNDPNINTNVINRIKEFKIAAAALNRIIADGVARGAIYTDVRFGNL
jgi:hypothetical protein